MLKTTTIDATEEDIGKFQQNKMVLGHRPSEIYNKTKRLQPSNDRDEVIT